MLYKDLHIKGAGKTIGLETMPNKHKLRQHSVVDVTLNNTIEAGRVTKIPRYPKAEIDFDSCVINNVRQIKSIRVQRFAELNYTLEETIFFISSLLSSKDCSLSAIEQLIYL